MLSFLVALLQTDPQQHRTEQQLKERAVEVFAVADNDRNGKLTKQEVYNYLADVRVNMSHYTIERLFRQLSGGADVISQQQFLQGLERYHKRLLVDFRADATDRGVKPHSGYGRRPSRNSPREPRPLVKFGSYHLAKTVSVEVKKRSDMTLADILPDPSKTFRRKPGAQAATVSKGIPRSDSKTDGSLDTAHRTVSVDFAAAQTMPAPALGQQTMARHTMARQTMSRQALSRLAATQQLERDQADRIERIRIRNVQKAMEPVKEVLAMIDESGIGKMSYHDFYFFLERTNPHMVPAASSIFFTLDRCMSGEVRFKDILRVLYPHAYEDELTEMLRLVTKKRQVKGQGSVQHQLAELKEIFACYDEDGSGQLDQKEFTEALMAAGFDLAEAQHMFEIIDSDHGGTISLEEFADWYLHHAPARNMST